jgi:hypothetical protein
MCHVTRYLLLTLPAGNARQALIDDAMADFDEVTVKPYRLDQLLRKMEDAIRKINGASPNEEMDSHVERSRTL